MEHGTTASNPFCAYKLDLSKAYDRVDWVFLEEVMHKMGFFHRWIQWIMVCVTTVRYSVKFNGSLLEAFSPTRGLRQGDPLSPFLFLFVADGLSALLQSEISTGGITLLKCVGEHLGSLISYSQMIPYCSLEHMVARRREFNMSLTHMLQLLGS
jgi:hypothetical protein